MQNEIDYLRGTFNEKTREIDIVNITEESKKNKKKKTAKSKEKITKLSSKKNFK